MHYIKKSDIEITLVNELKLNFENNGFKWISGKKRFFKSISGGQIMVDVKVDNAYNFDRDEIAWKCEIIFFAGFEAVHEWFEPFEHRKRSDYKYYWTIGKNLEEITGEKFIIDVDDSNWINLLKAYASNIYKEFFNFFENYKCLEKIGEEIIPDSINSLDDISKFKSFNIRTAIDSLTIAWLLKRNDFESMLRVFNVKLKELDDNGDPMVRIYFPKLKNIIETLKKTNFRDAVLCLEN